MTVFLHILAVFAQIKDIVAVMLNKRNSVLQFLMTMGWPRLKMKCSVLSRELQ